MKYYLLLALAIVVLSQSAPNTPVWPNTYQVDFEEVEKYSFITFKNKGTIYYDWVNKRYRVDRDNGKGDRYCGSVYKLTSTPCSHIVSEGKRYLYFPEKNDCCYCCDDAHGCGLVKPDWMTGADFEGYESDSNGSKIQRWNQKGMQNNIYKVTDNGQLPVSLDQEPNDLMNFNTSSFTENVDSTIFQLPSICSASKTCTWLSICTPLRK